MFIFEISSFSYYNENDLWFIFNDDCQWLNMSDAKLTKTDQSVKLEIGDLINFDAKKIIKLYKWKELYWGVYYHRKCKYCF